ncbi:MAG: hypothetical protein M3540_10945 [Actinomycetota bacterium]|nr:hypothetical protein [Actinomycetota bacterium]
MRKTTTTYACDSCGKKVAKESELQRYDLDRMKGSSRLGSVRTELCADCEPKFLASARDFVGPEGNDRLATWMEAGYLDTIIDEIGGRA